MRYELRDLILEVAAKYPTASQAEKAAYVVKMTDDVDLVDFYEDAVALVVRDVLRAERITSMKKARHGDPSTTISPLRGSRKVAGIASWWARFKDSLIPTETGDKRVGSCTQDDVRFIIARRQRNIDAALASLHQWESILDDMVRLQLNTVDDLPER
jgi:hypothetical protein